MHLLSLKDYESLKKEPRANLSSFPPSLLRSSENVNWLNKLKREKTKPERLAGFNAIPSARNQPSLPIRPVGSP